MRRAAFLFACALGCAAGIARAEPRPSLDDFYDRTRSRAEGFDRCLGHCDGETLAAFLVGAQMADPSTDAVERALAYGGRFGVDLGVFFGHYDVARTKIWADLLRVADTDQTVTDLAWKNTWFWSSAEPGSAGVQLATKVAGSAPVSFGYNFFMRPSAQGENFWESRLTNGSIGAFLSGGQTALRTSTNLLNGFTELRGASHDCPALNPAPYTSRQPGRKWPVGPVP